MDLNQSKIIFLDYKGKTKTDDLIKVLVWRAAKENTLISKLSYSFVSRERIVDINRDYINHDYETDIITFDYSSVGIIEGEIFICPEVVKDNALRYEVNTQKELQRVIFHGLLHLLGLNDQTDLEKEHMRREEDVCILKLEEVDNV